jgi:MFS family permease
LWCSALATAVGAGLFTIGRGVPTTLLGAGVFGLAGTTLLAVVQAILSDRHGSRRDRALTEANIGAGASAVLAPLVLGALAASVVGWRATFALPAVVSCCSTCAIAADRFRYRLSTTPPVEREGCRCLLAVRRPDRYQFGDRVLSRVLRSTTAHRHRSVRRCRQHRAEQ